MRPERAPGAHRPSLRGGLRIAIVLVIGLMLLGGCAQGDPGTSAATDQAPTTAAGPATPQPTIDIYPREANKGMAARYPIDPCELLTEQDVGDALSEEVEAGKSENRVCTWATADGATSLTLVANGEGQKPRNVCSNLAERGEPVEGLGEPHEAAYSDEYGLSVFTGEKLPSHSCLIFFASPREKLGVDALMDLAKIALKNHPYREDDW